MSAHAAARLGNDSTTKGLRHRVAYKGIKPIFRLDFQLMRTRICCYGSSFNSDRVNN